MKKLKLQLELAKIQLKLTETEESQAANPLERQMWDSLQIKTDPSKIGSKWQHW